MTATVLYDSAAEIAVITAVFLNPVGTGMPADPAAVSCTVTDPAGGQVVHSYLGTAPADIVKTMTGKYTLSVPCSPSVPGADGLWSFVWVGTGGGVSDVQPGTFRVFSPALGQAYAGLEELKGRLGITDTGDDYEAQQALVAATQWITDYCGQHFYRVTETRTYVPLSTMKCNFDPLVSCTQLSVDQDGDGTFEEAWVQGRDYQLRQGYGRYNANVLGVPRPYREALVLQAGRWFPFVWPYSHYDRVQIAGTWGWAMVPPPVTQSCLTLAAEWFKMKDAPFGVAGVTDYGVIRVQQNPWVVEQLRPYVNPKRKVGV